MGANSELRTLALIRTTRSGGKNESPRTYFDFFVSGQSLQSILQIEDMNMVSLLGWEQDTDYDQHLLNVFLLKEKPVLQSGRVVIYGCPACGDINCGAITAIIEETDNGVKWRYFGYENEYGGLELFENRIVSIEFEKTSYFAAFSRMLRQFSKSHCELPDYIDGAKVMVWAWSEAEPFGFVGTTAIHGLAICKYEESGAIYRFSCDSNWHTIQDSDYQTIDQAINCLPEQYKNVEAVWREK